MPGRTRLRRSVPPRTVEKFTTERPTVQENVEQKGLSKDENFFARVYTLDSWASIRASTDQSVDTLSCIAYTLYFKMHPEKLLQEIAKIRKMERGSIALNKPWGRSKFHNHTVYERGKSRTRYVREDEVDELRGHIAAYKQFKELVGQYEDLIIQQTRAEREKVRSSSRQKKRRKS